jgi:signal peptidase II
MHRLESSSAKRTIIFFIIVFLIAIADQLSKLWITTHLTLGQSLPETGFFRLNYVQNTGAVFGLFHGNNAAITVLVIIEGILILLFFFVILGRYPFLNTRLNTISSGLILGGLIGNLIDRIRVGYVTDFIRVGPWPNFNLADSSGVIGVFLLAFSILLLSRHTFFEHH